MSKRDDTRVKRAHREPILERGTCLNPRTPGTVRFPFGRTTNLWLVIVCRVGVRINPATTTMGIGLDD